MTRARDPDERPAPPDPPRPRLDDLDPSVDLRFRFNVSVPPVRYVASTRAGWSGARLVEGDSGFVRSGEIENEHEVLVLERYQTPSLTRPIGRAGGWRTSPPGVKLFFPGDREFGEWCGRPRAQVLFVTPERAEATLGTPWETSGLTRWRDDRHALPFVEHVVTALMQDLEAGHPAGPIAGDALVTALLLHLDGAGARAPLPTPGALGRRLDVVRDYVEDHLARPLQLAELAALAGVGVRRFGAIFQAETGCSPQVYVLRRRVERAKMLLRDSELSLAQIARAVGFTGAAQLARVFCQHAGVPPGTYRSH